MAGRETGLCAGRVSGRPELTVPHMSDSSSVRRLAISVQGIVQGVGFRPFVYNLAQQCGLSGWVANESDAVRMEIQGPAAAVSDFVDTLRADCPPAAEIRPRAGARIAADLGERRDVCRVCDSRQWNRLVAPADGTRRYGHVQRLPDGNRRTNGAAVPLPLHQLHELWTALVDHHGTPLRPPPHLDGGIRDVRSMSR